jgi:hypothetical protein
MRYPRMSKRPRITADTEADRYPQFPCTENYYGGGQGV